MDKYVCIGTISEICLSLLVVDGKGQNLKYLIIWIYQINP